jgi:hypothetical protein
VVGSGFESHQGRNNLHITICTDGSHLTRHIAPPQSRGRARFVRFDLAFGAGRWDSCHASFEFKGLPRCGIICHWHKCGVAVGLWFTTSGHGAVDLLLHNKIEEVQDLLVGLSFSWGLCLGGLSKSTAAPATFWLA